MTQIDLSRRGLLLAGGAALAAPLAAFAAADGALAFEVWRGGRKIGEHAVDVTETAGGRVARINAEMTVHVGPLPIFRYRHEATETWAADRFASLVARSTSNGKVETVSARKVGEAVQIERSGGAAIVTVAACSPLTHWNREALARPLFNPQTGALVKAVVRRRPAESVTGADGRPIAASAYALTGDADITDWYDASGAWAALRGKVADGSTIEYRRL